MGIWTILGGIAIGLLSSLLAVEIADRSNQLSSWLVRRAVKRLPAELQTLHEEAWLADVEDKAGRFGRIIFAAGLITAASKMSHEARLPNVPFLTTCVIRALDIGVAGNALFLLFPLLLSVMMGIWLSGFKPIFTRTQRVGLNGELFFLYNFNTRNHLVIPEDSSPSTTCKIRSNNFGQLLRLLNIDQIPNLFSVLVGDMSFVGPRPQQPKFVELAERIIPNYSIRQKIRPGITGWAQINYPYGSSVDDAKAKLRYDLEAVELYSVGFWFICWVKTLWIVLRQRR